MSYKKNFAKNMAYKIHWLHRAEKDLDTIYQYYKLVASEDVAKRRLSKILQATDTIAYMPNIGPVDDDFPHIPKYHYFVAIDYKIYYFVEEQMIYIAAIWDCRQ